MELQELYERIHLQPEIIEKLRLISEKTDLSSMDQYLQQMLEIHTAAQAYQYLNACLQDDENHLKMLYCQLECARRTFDRYREKQIAEKIYIDTMKCFPRFLEECRRKNGRMFFDRGWWTYRQISMKLFRIGALEYEFSMYEGVRAIAVHIPSDADFSKEAVDASLEQAGKFFKTYYSDYCYDTYICNSWLLSPVLQPLLSEQSHILSFQKCFDLIQVDKEDTEFIEWLFQVPADTEPGELPTETSLQKSVRKLLQDGGMVGSAFGVMKRCPKESNTIEI